ncbi:CLUMA_CG014546, isoform A [Clunio marinus]|uniref:CLUMA_CG014546, isoform A n=1 Tax=Clunio marinus TaxID=568069 RepID=A0A1J1IL55_9DIPT|nr:CLUMA_CG014546, isoform A [Clunio marinus]
MLKRKELMMLQKSARLNSNLSISSLMAIKKGNIWLMLKHFHVINVDQVTRIKCSRKMRTLNVVNKKKVDGARELKRTNYKAPKLNMKGQTKWIVEAFLKPSDAPRGKTLYTTMSKQGSINLNTDEALNCRINIIKIQERIYIV